MTNIFGMRVYNHNGSSFIFDENCSVCKILGTFKYHPTTHNDTRKTGVYIPNGYQEAVGFSSQSTVFYDDSSGYRKYKGLADISYYLDENRQVILKQGDKGITVGNYVGQRQDCIIFAWPKVNAGEYGLSFNNHDNFSKITDTSNFSFVAYKGDVEITSGGWAPSSIDSSFNFDNTVIFFHWEDGDISLVKYYSFSVWDGHIMDRKYLFYNRNGDVYSGSVKVKIVIFGNKDLEKSKYGVKIYSNDDTSFEVDNGILIRPTFYSMRSHQLYEFKNIQSIKRPMILPTTIGGYAKGWQTERAWCSLAVANNGFQLAPSPAQKEWVYYNRFNPLYVVSNYPILILDAENYFNFGG